MAPLSPGATQTSTSCSIMFCPFRPGKDLRQVVGSQEKAMGRLGSVRKWWLEADACRAQECLWAGVQLDWDSM